MRRASRRVERRLAMKRRAYLNKMRRTAREPVMEGKELKLFRAMDAAHGGKDKGELRDYIEFKIDEDPDIIQKLGRYLSRADLSDMNLSQVDFTTIKGIQGGRLAHTNFSDSELERANLSGLTLNMANLEGANLEKAQFVGSTLLHTNINNTCLRGANFTRANLGNANMATADGLERVVFNNAIMNGVIIMDGEVKECSFLGVKEILSVNGTSFKDTDLVGIKFTDGEALADCTFSKRTDLSRITYSGSFGSMPDLASLIFESANLEGSSAENGSFVGTNLDRAFMKDCKLKGGDFTNAKMRGTILRGADLSDGSSFEGANLKGAFLQGANLEGAILEGALSLEGVKLNGANLRGAELAGVNLNGAVLDGADLSGADLSGVDLSNVSLKNIKTDKRTKMDMSFGRKLRKFITRKASQNPTAQRRVAARFVEGLYAEEVESNEDDHMGMYNHMSEEQEIMAMMDDHMGYEDDHMGYDMDDEF